MSKPSVGRIVHYVSYGTPGGEYSSVCRAAVVTAVVEQQTDADSNTVGSVSLCVLNPEGVFFNQGVLYHDGAEQPSVRECLNPETHGNPFRYCQCGWMEATPKGGTWHWPERT